MPVSEYLEENYDISIGGILEGLQQVRSSYENAAKGYLDAFMMPQRKACMA